MRWDILGCAFERHDTAYKRASQAVVQVMRKVKAFAKACVGDLQFVLTLQCTCEFRPGRFNALRQVLVEAFDSAQVRDKMPTEHECHADHLQLRR